MANIIVDKTFRFAQEIITVYLDLREKGHYKIADQLVKSGTSIGANVEEAQAAHSKLDFVAKLTISNKEARETRYWLRLLDKKELLSEHPSFPYLKSEIEEIILLLNSIIKKSRENLK
ncbi:four helix bundle protein [Algoriphagus iocasae]|jgi:four helix bundle protein|uniref:Four helix bundle protein n=1 Tax=Algoriphagus iocasae TaxID=1836499 RepID=A0A841MHQ1_9BACT|nr:four helix bundle protein [Algoriphagus iocasae]MBB6327792.1 four helix bundle protein [Algoriphagus iocasae]